MEENCENDINTRINIDVPFMEIQCDEDTAEILRKQNGINDDMINRVINVKYGISFIPSISDITLNRLNSELNAIIEMLQR